MDKDFLDRLLKDLNWISGRIADAKYSTYNQNFVNNMNEVSNSLEWCYQAFSGALEGLQEELNGI